MSDTSIREIKAEDLLRSGYTVLLDAGVLKDAAFTKFFRAHFEILIKNSGRFAVPAFVKETLTGSNADLVSMAISRGLLGELRDVQNDTEALEQLKKNNQRKVAILVNDPSRKRKIVQAAKAAGLFVNMYGVSEEGQILQPPRPSQEKPERPSGKQESPTVKPERPVVKQDRPAVRPERPAGFSVCDRPEKIAIAPLAVSGKLSVGSVVRDGEGKTYTLKKQEVLNSGAITYSTDVPGVWVKLFEGKSLNTFTEAKIRRMLTQTVTIPGVCWPKSVVTDESGVFRGYTLQEFKGHSLHLCVFKRAGIEHYFPHWTKLDLCELTETILKKIRFLHNRNILFGCINPAAIFVAGKDEVYFTDTDNYQIDGFPCLVYNLSFTAPELLDKRMYFATKASENFAVAELVFMLMMPGKTPYASGTEEAPVELIRRMQFPYSSGRLYGKQALPGMWRFMWSHLESLKGSFYNVFQSGGKYSKPEERKDAVYWESAVRHYREYLADPEDPESLKIYPETFKHSKGEVFYRCRYCGKEHPRFYFPDKYFDSFRICNACMEKRSDVSFTCKACGKTYYYTNSTALFHKMKKMQDSEWQDQKYCSDCKKKTLPCNSCGKQWPVYHLKKGTCPDCNKKRREEVYKEEYCLKCGSWFNITVEEHEYRLRNGREDYTWCPDCRKNARDRKNDGSGYTNTYSGSSRSGSSYSGGSRSGSSYSGTSYSGNSYPGGYGRKPEPKDVPEKKRGLFGWLSKK